MEKTISVNIMVCNEERSILRCIKSVMELADEIIIIDTGSKDKTIEIIEGIDTDKIKLFYEPWNDNFAEIRNKMIEKSNCDIIFQIDADEYLCPSQDIDQIRKDLLTIDKSLGAMPRIIDINGSELGRGPVRIFKNFSGYYYFGDIHEEVRNEREFSKELLDIQIIHDGYTSSVIKAKNKAERNKRISYKMSKKENDNPRWRANYIKDLFYYEKDKLKVLKEINLFIKDYDKYKKEDMFNILEYLKILKSYLEIIYTNKMDVGLNQLRIDYPCNIDVYFLGLLLIQKKVKEDTKEINNILEEYSSRDLNKCKSFFDKTGKHIDYLFFETYYLLNDYAMIENFYNRLNKRVKAQIYEEKIKKISSIFDKYL